MPQKSSLDIFVLAVLSEGPLHGYEIIAQMRKRNFDRWIDVGNSSIYQSLSRLEKKELVKTSEIRIGKNPPRTVYELNKEGKQFLHDGLLKILRKAPSFPDEFNIPLFASDTLDKNELITALEDQKRSATSKRNQIEKALSKFQDKKSDVGMKLIYERLLALHKAHIRWLTDAIFLVKRR